MGGPGAAAPAVPVTMGGPSTRDQTRLDNGVSVLVEENHAAPVVAIQVWVASGAGDDPVAGAGTAHLFEHLVFRGTQRRPPGGAAREVEAVGGRLGAWTGLDETVYGVVVGAPFLELGLDVLADALATPRFDPAEVERARRTVLDEQGRAAAEVSRRMHEALLAAVYPGEPYGQPLLGTPATIASLTPPALAARFGQTYVGSALTVVVVGDVDAAAARAKVARAFSQIPRRPPASAAPAPAVGASPERASATAPARAARVSFLALPAARSTVEPEAVIGFRLPRLSAEEGAALDLLAAALARDGAGCLARDCAGRLDRELVRNSQLAIRARASTFASRRGALLMLSLTPAPRRIDAAVEAALDETLALGRQPLADDEVARARVAIEADGARGAGGLEGHARRLGYAAAVAGDPDFAARYRRALATLGPAEIQAVAAKHLRASAAAVVVMTPDAPARASARPTVEAALRPRLEAILTAADARASGRAAPPSSQVGAGDVVRFVAPSGLRVLVVRDTTAPVVAVRALWSGGSQLEDAASNGASTLIATLLDRGTRTRSSAQIDAELDGLGAAMGGGADLTTLGLRADLLPRSWERGLALVADCLRRPSFPEAEVEVQRRALLDRIRGEAAGPTAAGPVAALRLFYDALWPQHPYRLDPLGAPDTVSGLTRLRLLDHYRRNYPISRLVIAVVGDVDPKAVVAALVSHFPAPGPASGSAAAPASPSLPAPPAPRTEPVTVARSGGGDDAYAVVGYPTFAPGDPNRDAVEVLAEILRAERGRIEAPLLAEPTLGARAQVLAPGRFDPGYLAVVLSAPPARLDAAVAPCATRSPGSSPMASAPTRSSARRAAWPARAPSACALRPRWPTRWPSTKRSAARCSPTGATRRAARGQRRRGRARRPPRARPAARGRGGAARRRRGAPRAARRPAGEGADDGGLHRVRRRGPARGHVLSALRRARHRSVHRHRRRRSLPDREPHRRGRHGRRLSRRAHDDAARSRHQGAAPRAGRQGGVRAPLRARGRVGQPPRPTRTSSPSPTSATPPTARCSW